MLTRAKAVGSGLLRYNNPELKVLKPPTSLFPLVGGQSAGFWYNVYLLSDVFRDLGRCVKFSDVKDG